MTKKQIPWMKRLDEALDALDDAIDIMTDSLEEEE